jgi:hypothetical protein
MTFWKISVASYLGIILDHCIAQHGQPLSSLLLFSECGEIALSFVVTTASSSRLALWRIPFIHSTDLTHIPPGFFPFVRVLVWIYSVHSKQDAYWLIITCPLFRGVSGSSLTHCVYRFCPQLVLGSILSQKHVFVMVVLVSLLWDSFWSAPDLNKPISTTIAL